jgi:membrane protein YqaA with SNARE-associated domain
MVGDFFDALRAIGPLGVLLIAVLDSSFLSIPEVNDLIIVSAVAERPALALTWPLLTTLGSVIGCLMLFGIARKGGKAFLHKISSRHRVEAVERLYAKYGAWTLIIPALCPPPTPFKIFVAAAGALQFPPKRFIATIVFARSVRYYTVAVLSIIYGRQVEQFIRDHAILVALIIIVVVTVVFFGYRLIESRVLAAARSDPKPPELRKDKRVCA